MSISASDVAKLRKTTGAGMMDCKKALTEANGDFDRAIQIIREKGQAVASKRADREASEGNVIAKVSADGKHGALIALNCETDFVAKNEDFVKLAHEICDLALEKQPADLAALKALPFKNGKDVEGIITEQIGIIGEKLELACYESLSPAGEDMKICAFLWVYYGYPNSNYEGENVEIMRYRNGTIMARDERKRGEMPEVDYVAGVPDSGTAHAVGYANESGVPFARPFIKYTPTWPRSFMPTTQKKRDLIAKMKLIPVEPLIKDKSLLLIDDSIVRGTQLRETTEFLFDSGAKAVHVRPACPPLLFGCKYLNFSRSNSEQELIARRVIADREGTTNVPLDKLQDYANPESKNYKEMELEICRQMKFTTLAFNRLDDMVNSVGIEPCKLCTYCWSGQE